MWVYLKKVWDYRALVQAFALKDVKVKFAQTTLRLSWAVLQPLTATFVFAFFFGYVLDWRSGNLPFALYVLSGLLGWNLFSTVLIQGIASIHESGALIRKIYFPKLIMPLSKVLGALLELGISLILLLALMLWFGVVPGWRLLLLPAVVAMNVLVALTLVCWFGAFSYKTRDIVQVVPFITYFGIWFTPVFFTLETLPEHLRFIWYLNPMAGIVDAWRACLFADWHFDMRYLFSMAAVFPFLFLGLWIYCRKETRFSDFV